MSGRDPCSDFSDGEAEGGECCEGSEVQFAGVESQSNSEVSEGSMEDDVNVMKNEKVHEVITHFNSSCDLPNERQ